MLKVGDKVKIVKDDAMHGAVIGDVVTIVSLGNHITNHRINFSNGGGCMGGDITEDGIGCPLHLELIKEEEMTKYKVGDKFFRDPVSGNYTEEILAVVVRGSVAYYVTVDENDDVELTMESDLDSYRQEGAETEVTLEEIAKKFNVNVKSLRIKD